MGKFRKKPVVVEAIQFTKELAFEVFSDSSKSIFGKFRANGGWHPVNKTVDSNVYISIPTLEGNMKCNLNDWIIKGVKGEFYPCKPDIFEATYEPV